MRRALLVGLASVVGVGMVYWLPGRQYDFVFDWLTARAFIEGVSPYVPQADLASAFGIPASIPEMQWIAPRTPGNLLLFAPIGWVPFEWSFYVGRLLTVASAFLLAVVLARLAGRDWLWFVAAVPGVLLVWPFSWVLATSQTGFLVAALIGITWLMGNRWTAGTPLAVAITLKLWPWLLIPGLWLAGRRKAALGAGVGLAILNLMGLVFPHISMSGVTAMLREADLYPSMSPWTASPIVLAVVAFVVLYAVSRRAEPFMASIAIALVAAPTFWAHYLPALLVPLAIGIPYLGREIRVVSRHLDASTYLGLTSSPTAGRG